MKKLLLSNLIAFVLCFLVSGQPVMTYQTHALKAGNNNPMLFCAYAEPGAQGANVSWDFSNLLFIKDFVGYLNNAQTSSLLSSFPDANTELAEFDSRFYFKVTKKGIEQYGYSSADGNVKVDYTVPFVKMKYPFKYGDSYSGSFSGNCLSSGVQYAELNGNYTVEADAYGTLILPGNVVYENVIRIKTTKIYTNHYQNADEQVDMTTYRWYNATYRYPLLVLTAYTTKTAGGEFTNYQAAYNNKVLNSQKSATPILSDASVKLYPNPARSELTLQVEALNKGVIGISIYNSAGKLIKVFNREVYSEGIQNFDLSGEIRGLMPASYILKVDNGSDKQLTFEFSLIN